MRVIDEVRHAADAAGLRDGDQDRGEADGAQEHEQGRPEALIREREEEVRVVVGVHHPGDDDRRGNTGDPDQEPLQHVRGHVERATLVCRLEAPRGVPVEPDDRSDGDDRGAEPVAGKSVGLMERDDPRHGDAGADDELDQPGRLERLALAAELHLHDGDDDQRDREQQADRVDLVAVVEDVRRAVPLRGEDPVPEPVSVGVTDVADLDLVDDQLREAELGADQHVVRGERDREAREAGLLDQPAVHVADRERDRQRERDRHPQREPGATELTGLLGQHDDEDSHGAGHRSGREVELAADHQHRHGDGHDAERRGGVVDQVRGAVGGAERDRDRPEEDPDADDTDQGADLGADEHPLEQAPVSESLVLALDGRWRGGRRRRRRLVGR